MTTVTMRPGMLGIADALTKLLVNMTGEHRPTLKPADYSQAKTPFAAVPEVEDEEPEEPLPPIAHINMTVPEGNGTTVTPHDAHLPRAGMLGIVDALHDLIYNMTGERPARVQAVTPTEIHFHPHPDTLSTDDDLALHAMDLTAKAHLKETTTTPRPHPTAHLMDMKGINGYLYGLLSNISGEYRTVP